MAVAVAVTPGDGTLSLTWPMPINSYAAAVKWRTHPSGAWSIALAVTSYEITGLVDGVEYDVQVVLLPAGGTTSTTGTPAAPVAPVGPPVPIPPPPVIE